MEKNPRFIELLNEMETLYTKKNEGYAGKDSPDPFRNFRFSEMIGISPFNGCLVRMWDKMVRVSNLTRNPGSDKVGERITDTLMDLSVYCLIAICLYEEEFNTTIEKEI